MVFKINYMKAGGHVHCRLFVAKHPNQTYAACGNFTVSAGDEFKALQAVMPGVGFTDVTPTADTPDEKIGMER